MFMDENQEPLLGLATTKQLLEELQARAKNFPRMLGEPELPKSIEMCFAELENHMMVCYGGLGYRTVDH